jgi:murein L,D-transpeptidase YcbB/YkuD
VSDAAVVSLKKRLQATGQLSTSDTSAVVTEDLINAIKAVQGSYGVKQDGVITPALVKSLNVPAIERIGQLLLNLERMRWMPAEPSGELIWVNIPEFKLYVRDGSKTLFNMDVVVGKEGHSTVMFSGNLNQVVFSPYWNLPENIVKNEVLPDIEKNKNYLAENNMEITGEEDGVPVVRQLPGDKNQLGKIKFLFPNSFNIYFHDTPFKELFKKDKRAFSHGCIRLSEPEKLAEFLLADQSEWTREKIDSAMNAGKEKYVKVKNPVPVLIYYYTAWVDDNKVLQFRDDIYGHDKRLARKLFMPASPSNTLAIRQ